MYKYFKKYFYIDLASQLCFEGQRAIPVILSNLACGSMYLNQPSLRVQSYSVPVVLWITQATIKMLCASRVISRYA